MHIYYKDLLCKCRKLDQNCQTHPLEMKTHFQYVSISLLLKMEAVGLIVLCTSSYVMNHVRNVQLCSFPASLVFMSMITIALLDSDSTLNPLMLSCSSSCMNLLAGCEALLRMDAPFTAVWLHWCGRVSRDLSWKSISMHNHAPSNTAVVRYWILTFFFTIPRRAVLLCHESLWFFGEQMVF